MLLPAVPSHAIAENVSNLRRVPPLTARRHRRIILAPRAILPESRIGGASDQKTGRRLLVLDFPCPHFSPVILSCQPETVPDGFRANGTIVAISCVLLLTYTKWQAAGTAAPRDVPNPFVWRGDKRPRGNVL